MSLSTSTNRYSYTGNNVLVDYSFPALFYDNTHLAVYLDGVLQVSGYTVTGAGNPAGGTVTFSVAPGTGVVINLLRTVPNTQQVTLGVAGAFPAKTVEKALDLDVMGLQQFDERLTRSMTVPVTESSISNLPTLALRKGKYLAFDPSTGDPIPADSITGGTTVTFGSWTPTISFGTPGNLTVVYSVQQGRYAVIGKTVHLWLRLITSTFTHTTASGTAVINGVPVAHASGIGNYGGILARYTGITMASYTQFGLELSGGSDQLTISASGSGVGGTSLTTAELPTGVNKVLNGYICYEAA